MHAKCARTLKIRFYSGIGQDISWCPPDEEKFDLAIAMGWFCMIWVIGEGDLAPNGFTDDASYIQHRWTPEEHRLFMKSNIDKIANSIKYLLRYNGYCIIDVVSGDTILPYSRNELLETFKPKSIEHIGTHYEGNGKIYLLEL